MHDDSGSSDVSDLPGPGGSAVAVATIDLQAICPAVLIGSDEMPVALCTGFDTLPIVHLLDPATGRSLTSLPLEAGNLFAGVYGYLDQDDQLVMVDGTDDLLRIAHRQPDGPSSDWELQITERTPLGGKLSGGSVVGVAPGFNGDVWFATDNGIAGFVAGPTSPAPGEVQIVALGEGERVANSISTSPAGATIATDAALYLLSADAGGRPEIRWRRTYERGPARNPGQLSHGTGSSPTFFGPTTGYDYVAIVDNARPEVNLLVVSVSGDPATGHEPGDVVCLTPVLVDGGPGSENSPMASGRTVVVASTYGYEYPAVPPEAGSSDPLAAAITGGMTRVDLNAEGSDCEVVWENAVRSSAVPKLSTADGALITMSRETLPPGSFFPEWFAYTVIDIETGDVAGSELLPNDTGDPLQLAGTVGPDRTFYQGTYGPLLRITPG
jgi:hypothetical protein